MDDYVINLQMFADDEKTEKATPKKRKEAKEKGQVLYSKEVNSSMAVLASFAGLRFFGKYMYDSLYQFSRKVIQDYANSDLLFTFKGIQNFMLEIVLASIKIVAPVILVILVIGVASNYMQVGFIFTTKVLEIKLSRLNPIEGFKRIFSKRALVELLKSVAKIFTIGYILYIFSADEMKGIVNLYNMNLPSIVTYIGTMVYKVGIRIGIVLFFLSVLDYGFQWWDHEKNLKMSRKELKDEYKQTEGDPQIKSKIKEKQRQMAMQRMMSDVPKADVIITNPTHYAIGLKYDSEKYSAPYILAKGKDLVAQNIKRIAKESNVPVIENKPLAQMLYKTVDIGEAIPEELYQAVAEILAYVYSLHQ